MVIDLASPFWGSIVAGTVLMIGAGTYHYIKTLVTLNFTEKKISNIISEMDSLHKDYKNQISKIKEIDEEKFKKLLDYYDNKISNIVKHNRPPKLGGGL